MPYNPSLNIVLGPTQLDPILADIQTAKDALGAIATVTLSNEESAHLNKVDNSRLPYVQRSVIEFGPAYTGLVSARVNTARADNLFEALVSLRNIESALQEFQDRVKDLSFNVEELLYTYTTDMYANAKRYQGDVEGADVVMHYLSEMFEGQGNPGQEQDTNP